MRSHQDNKLICIHVSDVEASVRRINALIIEANSRAGQWHVCYLREQGLGAESLALRALTRTSMAHKQTITINAPSTALLALITASIACLQRIFTVFQDSIVAASLRRTE